MTLFSELYITPSGFDPLLLTGDGTCLTRIDFLQDDRASYANLPSPGTYPFFDNTRLWLDAYFSHRPLPALPPLRLDHLSPFGRKVIDLLREIPYGVLTSYGALAGQIASERGIPRMSAQAVGGAVGRNPICIMIPCHRVIGSDGSLTGFGGGMKNKIALLQHEGIDPSLYILPV